MKEFKIGQKVRIVDNDMARMFNLYALGLIDVEFFVDELEANIVRYECGRCAMYDGWFVPPEACELVRGTDVIDHSKMVAYLAKPGEAILESLDPVKCHTLHMAVGISGEAGELLDAIKKYVVYGKELDRENVIEELGDLEFYMEGLRQGLGITRQKTIDANIAKLGVRYANGYSDKAAQERADKVEA